MADEATPVNSAPASDPAVSPVESTGSASQPAASAVAEAPGSGSPLPPERIDRYRILSKLGEGSMSIVYEAYDDLLERPVALKVLIGELAADRDALLRINREVEVLEKIKHPNVITFYDHGRSEEGIPFLVFEIVKGPTLAEIIGRRRAVHWEIGLNWMLDAAMALDEAWKHHVIHRDIKPGNMIIDLDGRLKIGDFGLAKAIYKVDDQTNGRIMMGTPRYMSPEMGTGLSLDFRADMYSLGATFYHLFVGQAPFEADTVMGIIMKHANMPLPPPHSIEPSVPHDISDILTRLLEKEPSSRYRSYDDLISDLRETKLAIQSRSNKRSEEEMAAILGINPYWADPRLAESKPLVYRSPAGLDEPLLAPPPKRTIPRIDPMQVSPSKPGPPDPGVEASEKQIAFRANVYLLLGLGILLIAGVLAFQRFYLPPDEAAQQRESLIKRVKLPSDKPRIGAENWAADNKERMQRMMSLVIQYEIKRGEQPRTLHDIINAGLATDPLLLDTWNNEFRYDFPRKRLTSDGPDGKAGSLDDFVLGPDMKFIREPDPGIMYDKKAR